MADLDKYARQIDEVTAEQQAALEEQRAGVEGLDAGTSVYDDLIKKAGKPELEPEVPVFRPGFIGALGAALQGPGSGAVERMQRSIATSRRDAIDTRHRNTVRKNQAKRDVINLEESRREAEQEQERWAFAQKGKIDTEFYDSQIASLEILLGVDELKARLESNESIAAMHIEAREGGDTKRYDVARQHLAENFGALKDGLFGALMSGEDMVVTNPSNPEEVWHTFDAPPTIKDAHAAFEDYWTTIALHSGLAPELIAQLKLEDSLLYMEEMANADLAEDVGVTTYPGEGHDLSGLEGPPKADFEQQWADWDLGNQQAVVGGLTESYELEGPLDPELGKWLALHTSGEYWDWELKGEERMVEGRIVERAMPDTIKRKFVAAFGAFPGVSQQVGGPALEKLGRAHKRPDVPGAFRGSAAARAALRIKGWNYPSRFFWEKNGDNLKMDFKALEPRLPKPEALETQEREIMGVSVLTPELENLAGALNMFVDASAVIDGDDFGNAADLGFDLT